jgi:deoxyhypusine synthase
LYQRIPHYRSLTKEDEQKLYDKGFNRVTDTCIPEEQALYFIANHLLNLWKSAEKEGKRFFPHEFIYTLLRNKTLEKHYQINPDHSWLIAASEKNLPVFVPGWEDSSTGNIFVSHVLKGSLKRYDIVKSGLEQMGELVKWYKKTAQDFPIGFFQIGGGIAGDFPICVVPLIRQDLKDYNCPLWSYFCQISDSTTSYGSYSGATPSEKITWGKLSVDTPNFIIESDATIVAPLIFQYVQETMEEIAATSTSSHLCVT